MNYIGQFLSNFKEFYNEINGATLTGAIDVIVVQQEDGEYVSSPFHVRFGKIGVLRSREKVVDIEINGEPVDIHMKLGETGEAFFVEKLEENENVSEFLGTSPLALPKFYSPNELDTDVSRTILFDEERVETTDEIVLLKQKTSSIDVPKDSLRHGHSRSRSFGSDIPIDHQVLVEGSRTDNEEVKNTKNRRKKRRKISQAKRLSQEAKLKLSDGHSSENSTTSETADMSFSSGFPFIMDGLQTTSQDPKTPHSTSMPQLCRKTSAWEPPFGNPSSSHPFSDTDISPPGSPKGSRSSTPVKSDTEYEFEKHKGDLAIEDAAKTAATKWSWTWGELPTPPSKMPSVPSNLNALAEDDSATLASGESSQTSEQKAAAVTQAQQKTRRDMFSFMRYTKKARHKPETEGIYLDEIDREGIDPELVSLYIPKANFNDRQFKPVSKDEDVESGNGTSLPQSPHSIEGAIGGPKAAIDSDFEDSHHPVFDYKGYHDVAFSLCGRLHEYQDGEFPVSLFMQSLITFDEFVENTDYLNNPNLVVRLNNHYFNWATAAPQIMSLVLFQRELPQKLRERLIQDNMPQKMRPRTQSKGYSWFSWGRGGGNQESKSESAPGKPSNPDELIASQSMPIVSSLSQEITDHRSSPDLSANMDPSLEDKKESSGSEDEKNDSKYRKSTRLTSEQIKRLNLKHGLNELVFSVTTAYQGTSRCKCHLFLWNHDEKIVISDIDGTITKSDVLGHILPIIGQDWAQSGVAELYTKIKNNGYSFLYLSARAIGQAHVTRDYLRSIKQDNRTLPDGPLLLNPTSLIQAFHREVIVKKPEEFKISCLKDIQALFNGRNPFYAGFGNRMNDVWAYSEVGVPITRIFTINHQGVIKHEHSQTFQTTYTNLSDIVHHMFPSTHEKCTEVEYSTMQYWKTALPDISEEISQIFVAKK